MSKKLSAISVIIWLMMCLTPVWVAAEEPVITPAGDGLLQALLLEERIEASCEFSLPELELVGVKATRLSDEYLDSFVATGFDTPSSEENVNFNRIILWDEASGKPNLAGDLLVKSSVRR